jgi:hypothetical protein
MSASIASWPFNVFRWRVLIAALFAIAIAIAQSARSINSGRPWRWLTDADRVLREAFAR